MTGLIVVGGLAVVFGAAALVGWAAALRDSVGLLADDPEEARDEAKLSWRSFLCEQFGLPRGQVEQDAERN